MCTKLCEARIKMNEIKWKITHQEYVNNLIKVYQS